MIAFLQCYTQDSLKLIPVPAWKLSRMIDEVQSGRLCDSLVINLDSTVHAFKQALQAGSELVTLRTIERDLKVQESAAWELRYKNKETIHDKEVRHIKRQKFYMTLGAIGEAVIIVLLIL